MNEAQPGTGAAAPADAAAGQLAAFNGLSGGQARELLLACCAAPAWAGRVADGRPYRDLDAVLAESDQAVAALSAGELGDALAGHPRIGQGAAEPGSRAVVWSSQEQSGVATASETARRELAELNAVYEQRFGHIYLVRAAGRSAGELLAMLRRRLDNDEATEWGVVRAELAQINRIRLRKLLAEMP